MKLSPLLLLALLPALNGCFGEAPPGGSQNQTIATDSVSEAAAVRFLSQSSFGATEEAVDEVIDYGIEGWIDAQIAMTSPYSDTVTGAIATPNAITTKSHLERTIEIAQMVQQDHDWYDDPDIFNSDGHWLMEYYQLAAWWEHSLKGDDQLRQRVAYALSQIFVVSTAEMPLDDRAESLANYYDILAEHAFGNFRDLMGAVSRSATMGIYLSHQGNEKENPATQTRPDENFARELMQLFTIGLYELNVDGTPRLSSGNLIPTYSQEDIVELAKVMTGWDLQLNSYYGRNSANSGDYTLPMEFTDAYHEYSAKTVLGETIPANLSGSDDLDAALDIIFAHANVAPFISRQLIQRLVTSNPSSAYIGRVAAVFNDNGSGVKGDLGAVVKAILMDDEARSASYISQPSFGKPREPVLAFSAMLRLLDISPLDGWSGYDENGVQPNFDVTGVYWFNDTELGQMPLRSRSVFNFYSPDFIPSDSYFTSNGLVAPELEIQTPPNLISFSNAIDDALHDHESNEIQSWTTLDALAGNANLWWGELYLTDLSDELTIFELALDGDSNGDYLAINDAAVDGNGDTAKARAIDALLDHLDLMLLAGQMESGYRSELRTALINFNDGSNNDEARLIITVAIRAIVTSSAFMIQK